MYSFKQFRRSMGYALRGFQILVVDQPNARIHLVITAMVVIAGLLLPLHRLDWIALFLAFGLVWVTEALNTAIEYHVDDTSPDHRKAAAAIKDCAAGAVLLAAMAAFFTGIMVFIPALQQMFNP